MLIRWCYRQLFSYTVKNTYGNLCRISTTETSRILIYWSATTQQTRDHTRTESGYSIVQYIRRICIYLQGKYFHNRSRLYPADLITLRLAPARKMNSQFRTLLESYLSTYILYISHSTLNVHNIPKWWLSQIQLIWIISRATGCVMEIFTL